MFNSKLRQEIAELAYTIEKLKTRVNCLEGHHCWGVDSYFRVFCKHCFTSPKPEKVK